MRFQLVLSIEELFAFMGLFGANAQDQFIFLHDPQHPGSAKLPVDEVMVSGTGCLSDKPVRITNHNQP